jgi:hypothetical protein
MLSLGTIGQQKDGAALTGHTSPSPVGHAPPILPDTHDLYISTAIQPPHYANTFRLWQATGNGRTVRGSSDSAAATETFVQGKVRLFPSKAPF